MATSVDKAAIGDVHDLGEGSKRIDDVEQDIELEMQDGVSIERIEKVYR